MSAALVTGQGTQIETESVVSYLVERGADINAQDAYGMTPLHYAAMRGNTVVAGQLLKCKSITVDVSFVFLCDTFFDQMPLQPRDKQRMTPMHSACAHGCVEVAELLLRHGADVGAVDEQLNNPLHRAAEEGHLNIVRLLFHFAEDNGRDALDLLTARDYENNTPLHLAVDNGHYDVIRYLLEQGADCNTHRAMFNAPLHAACTSGDARIVKVLLEVVLKSGQHYKELSQGYRKTTNNRMELLAVIVGLEAIKKEEQEVKVVSDSKYVTEAINQKWVFGWQKKGFKDKKNPDLWRRFLQIYPKHSITFEWIKGHDGHKENERCDKLAVAAATGESLLVDEGFENQENHLF